MPRETLHGHFIRPEARRGLDRKWRQIADLGHGPLSRVHRRQGTARQSTAVPADPLLRVRRGDARYAGAAYAGAPPPLTSGTHSR